ncbi:MULTISPECIES: hypothetical protein [Wolbachia]|nr:MULTISPECIES: hypothetical protein [Wolbachia]MDE5061263.1 hypothetical protein [Wolbachia endosymbiont of Drosophila nikananu]
MVNALKAKVKESKYNNLRPTEETLNSGYEFVYESAHNFIINRKVIANDFINNLCSKHKNLIQQDKNGKKDYRLFAKAVFTEMFEYAGAKVPNDSIIEKLITDYSTFNNRSTYIMLVLSQNQALRPFELHIGNYSLFKPKRICMNCDDPNCLKFSFSVNEGVYNSDGVLVCNLHNSVKFKLKCKDGNVTYEDGKVLLTIPKELKNYKVNDKNLFDIIVEYFQKFCEKLDFKFETKVEHSLGKPLKVLNDVNASHDKNLNLNLNN